MEVYKDKAFEILNDSIKSAIFIDENAKDFYSDIEVNPNEPDEQLSIDLFNSFKQNGKNLVIHKFDKNNKNPKLSDYLFSGKDLILLDWELDKIRGPKYSLDLLSEAIKRPYINFCCIYSRSSYFNRIPLYLTAYFSGLSKSDFENIHNDYSHIEEDEIEKIKTELDKVKIKKNKIKEVYKKINNFFKENEINEKDFNKKTLKFNREEIIDLIEIALNYEKYYFQDSDILRNYEIIHLKEGGGCFIINNTFILTIAKENKDKDCNNLIRRISDEVSKSDKSFLQLLGLEMQAIFNSEERFIDETILKSSTNALFGLRNYINDDKIFATIIKRLMLEQSTLKLRTAKLKLLDNDFLEEMSKHCSNEIDENDIMQLNTFYNSVTVKSLNNEDIPNLNFGDIFEDEDKNYYLCITALCDCYRPEKIGYNFYFVKGNALKDKELSINLSDTAFLSFLPNGKIVNWGNIESIPKENRKDKDEHIKILESFRYKPLYIKPTVYRVENNKICDNKISLSFMNKSGENELIKTINVEYITTLRNDYAQRIANHAFGHPARVGIEFVKKNY